MTAPEIKRLAEDLLALPPGPYTVDMFDWFDTDPAYVETEARRLNAMPGLLRAAADLLAADAGAEAFLAGFKADRAKINEIAELAPLIARCEAHQKGEADA